MNGERWMANFGTASLQHFYSRAVIVKQESGIAVTFHDEASNISSYSAHSLSVVAVLLPNVAAIIFIVIQLVINPCANRLPRVPIATVTLEYVLSKQKFRMLTTRSGLQFSCLSFA